MFYKLTGKTSHDIETAHDVILFLNSHFHKLFYHSIAGPALLMSPCQVQMFSGEERIFT